MDSIRREEVLRDGDLYAVTLREDDEQPTEKIKDDDTTNKPHQSTTDPDARKATKPYKSIDLKYLGQVSVDTAHHVITEIQAHHADKRDSQCVEQVVGGVIENLSQEGLEVEEVLCDSGYSSALALQYLNDRQINAYIPNHGQYKAEHPGFVYDTDYDRYTCSEGKHLSYVKTVTAENGMLRKEYRSSTKDCRSCALRQSCIGKGYQKRISEYVDKYLFDEMNKKVHTRWGRKMMRLRQSTVEPVLGTLVNFLGMRRVNSRGLEQANKCMIMSAIAYNLKKLLKFPERKPIEVINKMKKVEGIAIRILSYYLHIYEIELSLT
jgi:hypothetical protein